MFLEISKNLQKNTCASGSFLIKLQALGRSYLMKMHCSCRDAKVHRIQCGWLFRVAFISQTAILPLGLTSRGENYATQSRINELIISQKSSWVNKSKTSMYIVYTKMFHIQKDFFILNINWPVCIQSAFLHLNINWRSLHFFQFKMANFLINAIWFVKIYVIHSSSGKDDYYE